MATKEYININNLRAVPEGSSSYKTAKAVYKGNTKIYRACKGSIVVWDVWRAALTGSMAKVNPSGGSVLNYLTASSYYTDYAGTNHNLGYSVSPTSIAANESSSQVTGSIVITQNTTGLQTQVSYTQEADSIKDVTLGSPSITSLSVGDVGADGSGTSVFVYWQRTKTTEYNSGKREEEIITGSCDATGISGTSYNSGYTSGGTIYGSDRGTVTGSRRYCYYITSVTFSIDGTSFTASFTKYVYQEANEVSSYYGTSTISISSSSSSITAASTDVTITVSGSRPYYSNYTSGASSQTSSSITVNLSSTYGTFSSTSVSGSGSVTLTIPYNSSTSSSRSITVTGKSAVDNTSKSITITQAKDSVSTSYGTPSITSLSVADLPASGGSTLVTVKWSQTKTVTSIATGPSSTTVTGTSSATSITGTANVSGTTVSGGYIYGVDRGTTTGDRRLSYTISKVGFSANGKSASISYSQQVYQQANTYSTYYSDYSLTLSSPSSSIDSAGNSVSISCNCTRKATKSYTSGSEEQATEGVRCSLSTNHGSIYPTSITGSGSATLTAGENTSSSRNVIVTANSSAGSLTKTLTITQSGVQYVFSSESGDSISVPYTGGYAYWDIISSRNGVTGMSLDSSNFSISGDASVTYSGIEESGEGTGYYQVTFNVGNNTSVTSQKVSTVTATQPGSGKKMSVQIYVATKPSAPAYDLTYTNTDIVTGSISTKFTFRIDNTYSTSKTISELYIVYWSGSQANISLVEDVISAWEMGNPPVQSMMVTGGKTWANYSNIIDTYMNANSGSKVIAAYGSVEFTRTEGISKDDFGSFVNNGVSGVILYRDSVNGYGYQEF